MNTNINSLKQPTAVEQGNLTTRQVTQHAELWGFLRTILVIWGAAVWLLLVMMPGMQAVSDINSAMLHLPHVFIGLGLMGASFAAHSLRADLHMLWFLGTLLLLAGWM